MAGPCAGIHVLGAKRKHDVDGRGRARAHGRRFHFSGGRKSKSRAGLRPGGLALQFDVAEFSAPARFLDAVAQPWRIAAGAGAGGRSRRTFKLIPSPSVEIAQATVALVVLHREQHDHSG